MHGFYSHPRISNCYMHMGLTFYSLPTYFALLGIRSSSPKCCLVESLPIDPIKRLVAQSEPLSSHCPPSCWPKSRATFHRGTQSPDMSLTLPTSSPFR